jgi:glutathione S-transferase
MAEGRLIIGNKRYSSWSLRGWLAVRLAALEVEEVVIPLAGAGPGGTAAVAAASPNGLVPYLEHRGARVFESLAILEYCAEFAPALWPAERTTRAWARSVASEMHAGFSALRKAMPMNIGRDFPGQGRTPEALRDIARIEAVWQEALAAHGGPYLFGAEPCGADVMYAPVVCRFLHWQPELSAASQGYCATLRAHPLMQRWYAEAAAEPAAWQLAHYEHPEQH